MTEDTTCSDIEGTSFCEDLYTCAMGVCDNGRDCDAEGGALYTCAEENAEDDDEFCLDICVPDIPCGNELEALGECVGESLTYYTSGLDTHRARCRRRLSFVNLDDGECRY